MWVPLPPDPAPAGWWTELSFNRWVAGVAAEMRAADQAKRRRQLRRGVERVDEQMVLAAGASDARRTLHRQGIPYESRSAGSEEVEHFTRTGRILSVR